LVTNSHAAFDASTGLLGVCEWRRRIGVVTPFRDQDSAGLARTSVDETDLADLESGKHAHFARRLISGHATSSCFVSPSRVEISRPSDADIAVQNCEKVLR